MTVVELEQPVVAAPDDQRDVHVYPTIGREHEVSRACWCRPAEIETNLIVHNYREVS